MSSAHAGIIGVSEWAVRTREAIATVANSQATVLITGPTGTGKELIARTIHAESGRRDQPFIPVDCAATSSALFGSQLFGHQRGAFTGATEATLGAFRAADGGTLFLDELGELQLHLQGSLLRVLQERQVIPLGAVKPIPVDVRVVTATNRDLSQEVADSRFREDLFYRLNVVHIRAEPIASRRDDLPALVHFLQRRLEVRHGISPKTFTPEAWEEITAYDWPGNVRELDNLLERLLLFCQNDLIEPEDLPWLGNGLTQPVTPRTRLAAKNTTSPMETSTSGGEEPTEANWATMAEVQREHLWKTLKLVDFNQTRAALLLGLDRHSLRRLAKRLDVDLSSSRKGRPHMVPPGAGGSTCSPPVANEHAADSLRRRKR